MADLDHNGHLDMYVTNGNQCFLVMRQGGMKHKPVEYTFFVSYQMPWGSVFLDYDNDGLLI